MAKIWDDIDTWAGANLVDEWQRTWKQCRVAISYSRRIFLIQGLNPDLRHCRWTFYHLSHQESLAIFKGILKHQLFVWAWRHKAPYM